MPNARNYPGPARRGFSLVEAVMSTLIVSGMLVAALTSVVSSRAIRGRMADRMRGQELAMDLMAEVLQQTYQPPAAPLVGRTAWTDLDDYNGLIDIPPLTKAGNLIPDCAGWSRTVSVQPIDPVTLLPSTSGNTGIKQITVSVNRGSLVVATVAAYRTMSWVDQIPKPTDTTSEHPPIASATGSPLSGHGGQLTVNFSGTGSSDQDGNTLSYVWAFGDGASGSGPTVSHLYTAAGTYTAALTVYDGAGGVGSSSMTVTVTP
jgi:type II secretory pathway pseudopilin PulG